MSFHFFESSDFREGKTLLTNQPKNTSNTTTKIANPVPIKKEVRSREEPVSNWSLNDPKELMI